MSLLEDSAWENKARNTPPGMADIAGGALPGVLCLQCRYFRLAGHYAAGSKHKGKAKPGSCTKYRQLMGLRKPGPSFPASSHACKHFEDSGEIRHLYRKSYDAG